MDLAPKAVFEASAGDHLHELAGILAMAIQRLRTHRMVPAEISPRLAESTGKCLELADDSRLTVTRG